MTSQWELLLSICFVCFSWTTGTPRYYATYLPYGTGDNFITLIHLHGGPIAPHRKWNAECSDGEALIGIQDAVDDFERLDRAWCKFMFPRKPPTNGMYPYYPSCLVRESRTNFFCFDAKNASASLNTFVTGLFDNEFVFSIGRNFGTGSFNDDFLSPYKCCKTPEGYYIDYVSCYYVSTKDPYWEYYDSPFYFIPFCGTGYVMTGLARKTDMWTNDLHLDWMQCCRLGFGAPAGVSPPIIYSKNGMPTFYAREGSSPPFMPTKAYTAQYRSLAQQLDTSFANHKNHSEAFFGTDGSSIVDSMRYNKRQPIPQVLSERRSSFQGLMDGGDGRDVMLRTDLRNMYS